MYCTMDNMEVKDNCLAGFEEQNITILILRPAGILIILQTEIFSVFM